MFHPAACLIVWLLFAVAVQFFGWTPLAVSALIIAAAGIPVSRRWWKLILRAKWLLLTLWFVLAYGTPGDLWYGQGWAPSIEGIEAASLHALRLIVLLGSLAWLFMRLPRIQFISGLWVLARPFRPLGVDADRSVARLGLVFDYLEHAPPRGTWRHFLDVPDNQTETLETIRLEVPRWKIADSGFLVATGLILILLAVLA